MEIKRLLQLGTVLTLILTSGLTNAQVRSTHSSPTNGVEYSSGTNGVCSGCAVTNAVNAADASGSNFAGISVPFGVAGTAFLRLKLTGTVSSGDLAGLLIERSGGLAGSTTLNTYSITTYLSGVAQETKSGSANLSAQLQSGSTTIQSIHFASSSDFDEIRIQVGALVTIATNALNVYYGYGNTTALPVEMINFYGSPAGSQIVLNWQTASEHNNSHYEIERMDERGRYSIIGVHDGKGNCNHITDYEYTDYNPVAGYNYYRLKQVDYDGAETYSKTVNVFYGKTIKKVTIISDYVNRSLRVSAEGGGLVELLNSSGEVVSAHNCESETDIDLNHLQNGVYWVKVTQLNGEVCTEKIVKM